MKNFNILILLVLLSPAVLALDIYDEISSAIRAGDSKQMASYFNSNVDLTIINREDIYSKAQTELLVKDFFSKNPPKTFTLIHKGSSKEGTLFAIGNLVTTNGKTFRTAMVLKMNQGKYLIHELRFESQ